jgi:hypothetical protein
MVDPIVLPVTMTRELPRFVIPKDVAGRERYYWTLPSYYRKLGCTLHKEHETALGPDFEVACEKAKTLNGLFDDWDRARLGEPPQPKTESGRATARAPRLRRALPFHAGCR